MDLSSGPTATGPRVRSCSPRAVLAPADSQKGERAPRAHLYQWTLARRSGRILPRRDEVSYRAVDRHRSVEATARAVCRRERSIHPEPRARRDVPRRGATATCRMAFLLPIPNRSSTRRAPGGARHHCHDEARGRTAATSGAPALRAAPTCSSISSSGMAPSGRARRSSSTCDRWIHGRCSCACCSRRARVTPGKFAELPTRRSADTSNAPRRVEGVLAVMATPALRAGTSTGTSAGTSICNPAVIRLAPKIETLNPAAMDSRSRFAAGAVARARIAPRGQSSGQSSGKNRAISDSCICCHTQLP